MLAPLAQILCANAIPVVRLLTRGTGLDPGRGASELAVRLLAVYERSFSLVRHGLRPMQQMPSFAQFFKRLRRPQIRQTETELRMHHLR